MDYWGIQRRSIRSDALLRLAKLSLEDDVTSISDTQSTASMGSFAKLLSMVRGLGDKSNSLSKVAITLKEYEVLISLCESTNFDLLSVDQAKLMMDKFKLYLLELPNQKFSPSIFESDLNYIPWKNLAEKLTISLISIGLKFDNFRDEILDIFFDFNQMFVETKDFGLSNYLTLIGFIDGLIKNSHLITKDQKSFEIFLILDSYVDNAEFLNQIESYYNSITINLDYGFLVEYEIVKNFSPILLLEKLSSLMCSIMRSTIKIPEGNLLENILVDISSRYEDNLEVDGLESLTSFEKKIITTLTQKSVQKMELLDRGETYIVYSSPSRLKIGYLAKSNILQVIGASIYKESIDVKFAKKCFRNCLEIKDFMLDPDLGLSVIQLGSLLVYRDEQVGSILTRAFTSLISNPKLVYSKKASQSVGLASKVLSQDAVVTTIYALTNLLFVGGNDLQSSRRTQSMMRIDSVSGRDFSISRKSMYNNNDDNQTNNNGFAYNEVDRNSVSENAVTAIIEISRACDDENISTLAVSILSQKAIKPDSTIGKLILEGLVACAPSLPEREFIILLRLLNRLSLGAFEEGNSSLLENVTQARVKLSHNLTPENPLYFVYLHDIMQAIISKGDVEELEHHRSHTEIREIGEQIAVHLKPLAELLPDIVAGEKPLKIQDTNTVNLFRNIWFNMIVHGYSINSNNTKKYSDILERIAYNTPPLASELSWNRTETSLELNTVLRRGSSNHNVKNHKSIMEEIFEVSRTLSYPKLMFLASTVFLESLRVKLGDASTILNYYSDPSIKTSGVDRYIGSVALKICEDFIQLINKGANKQFSADNIAEQLKNMLILCSHRVEELQECAFKCCDLLINKVPSSLCHPKSLFALFDLLTLLFNSIIDADINQYEPTTLFKAPRSGIELLLSDSYSWRKSTFDRFHKYAQNWLTLILLKSSIDVRSLIQSYAADLKGFKVDKKIQFGVSFALNMAGQILGNDREMSSISKIPTHHFNTLPLIITLLNWRSNIMSNLMNSDSLSKPNDESIINAIRYKISLISESLKKGLRPSTLEATNLLSDITGICIISKNDSAEMIRYLVEIPFMLFDPDLISTVRGFWLTVMKDRSDLSILLLSEIAKRWEISIEMRQGLFSKDFNLLNAEYLKQEYSPSDFKSVKRLAHRASKAFEIHLEIIRLFSSTFEATLNQSDHLLKLFTRFIEVGLKYLPTASLHPFARLIRFELIRFAFDVLNYHFKLGSRSGKSLTELILDASISWFRAKQQFPYGSNVLKIKADYSLLIEVARLMNHTPVHSSKELDSKKTILLLFLDDEISKFSVWLNPLNPDTKGKYTSHQIKANHITEAYAIDPILAINLAERYKIKDYQDILQNLIIKNPLVSITYPSAIQYYLGINGKTNMPSHYLLFWEPLSPIDCITLFLPPFGNDPYVLQYTMRSLEYHDVNLTFFYVPQIVQSLRFDAKGYVERFIIETAKVSQLFAHQIIWNMLANSFKDEESTDPDIIKPVLDRIQENMTKEFSPQDLEFYKKEFGFFNEVTSISGKLKPYIKKSKAEKKLKIDEEMAKIQVESDVYLPSNPDGVVIDINRKSGKPLQSHAKAPFMATFKIKKEVEEVDDYGSKQISYIEKWQSAIFKVGDDCRQDVLALQLISVFRSIWSNAGLDLYVYPYRVTATAPGCGVIDVLPNSTSRDMLGREAVNGLYEYFTTKFGPENSIEFQQARNNLIKSLAAYSIISYLLQFKDRHNGNIMYDDQGHILHIDFGFCFDIVPGGVKFETAPFKLTQEMVMVLGGSNDTQAFKWFEELCVKGYLACRAHMETIIRCVVPMLESGLPCFKETTIKKLRARFVPGKSDKEASAYMRSLIKKSEASFSTKGYDEFQKITNGIPY